MQNSTCTYCHGHLSKAYLIMSNQLEMLKQLLGFPLMRFCNNSSSSFKRSTPFRNIFRLRRKRQCFLQWLGNDQWIKFPRLSLHWLWSIYKEKWRVKPDKHKRSNNRLSRNILKLEAKRRWKNKSCDTTLYKESLLTGTGRFRSFLNSATVFIPCQVKSRGCKAVVIGLKNLGTSTLTHVMKYTTSLIRILSSNVHLASPPLDGISSLLDLLPITSFAAYQIIKLLISNEWLHNIYFKYYLN